MKGHFTKGKDDNVWYLIIFRDVDDCKYLEKY